MIEGETASVYSHHNVLDILDEIYARQSQGRAVEELDQQLQAECNAWDS